MNSNQMTRAIQIIKLELGLFLQLVLTMLDGWILMETIVRGMKLTMILDAHSMVMIMMVEWVYLLIAVAIVVVAAR
jgi:hypothetical protein